MHATTIGNIKGLSNRQAAPASSCRHEACACIALALAASLFHGSAGAQGFPSSSDKIPPGWAGPVFKLSQDYPKALPQDGLPWRDIDPTAEPERFARTIYSYVLEGNTQVDWDVPLCQDRCRVI